MKILQILPALEVGGVERGVIDLARALKKRGHDNVVISSGGELVEELQKMNVPHYTLPVQHKSLFSLGLVDQIAEIIERERVDIVHARSRVPAWLAWLAARKTHRPFMTTCHGYYSTHLLSRVMGWGKRVIVISRAIGRHMIDDFGVPAQRLRLVHRGVDLSQFTFQPKKQTGETSTKRFRILNVGRLSPIKGQVEFLKAVHLVRRELGQIEVMLVGSEGKGKHKYSDLIRQTIHQLGLESCVKMLGTRRDIPALLAESDLLVLSTLVPEAFGRVVVEAGAVGTPVLATRVGGVLDIIDDGENGALVGPGDIEGMAKEMISILKDPGKAEKFSTNLRKKVETRFTLDRMLDETLAVYEEAKREKKILVLKLGAMGDVILAIPSLRMIRERFPEAKISILVDKNLAPLLTSVPYLDEIIPVDRKKMSNLAYLLKTAKKIRTEGYDVSVDFQNSKWTHLAAWLGGISERYGFKRGQFGFLLNRPEPYSRKPEAPVQNQFRILSKLGVRQLDETLELWTESEAEKKIEQILPPVEDNRKTVGLVLGSSPSWPTKRWPADFFRELAETLIKEKSRVVLIGSKDDREIANKLNLPESQVVDLIGKTTLPELLSVVKRLDVLVSGDTAPLHVASAMKTKIVALFGPTDPRRHMPPSTNATVLVKSLPCQPCYRGTCRNKEELACLKQIKVEEVYRAVKKHIAQERPLAARS